MDKVVWEPLSSKRGIYVSKSHRFGTDAFLLADFCRPKGKDKAVDLGTGCGIIPTLWLGSYTVGSVVGVEISEEACALARKTIEQNGDGGSFSVECLDLRSLKGSMPQEKFDLVCCNPPYFSARSGYISPDPERAKARAELSCTIDDVCSAARYLLKYGGRLCVCYRPERLTDLLCAMRGCGIEPKRVQTVHSYYHNAPWLVLVEGKRGGKSSLAFEEPFYTERSGGYCSYDLERLYGDYREGRSQK